MIALINRLARKVADQGRIFRRLVGIINDFCWVRTLGLWSFDLNRSDAPWRRVREQNAIRWETPTVENCRQWSQSDADGFAADECELMIRLIEEKHLVLVGYERDIDDPRRVPDCYATCAFGRKPMTSRCAFYMEPNEGTIRTVYTRKRSRGRGLATKIYAELCCLAEERGLTKVYADIDFANIASFRAVEKAGAVRIRNVIVYETLLLKHAFIFVRGSLKHRFRQS